MLEPMMLNRTTHFRVRSLLHLACVFLATFSAAQTAPAKLDPEKVAKIEKHIASIWDQLTRSIGDCNAVVDSKLANSSVLYLPAEFPVPADVKKLQQECHVEVHT